MKGSTYKRCRCRRDGRELGAKCPQLHRADGSWNPNHGSWFFRVELEPDADGRRRILRRGGYATQRAAQAALDEAKGKAARGVDVTDRVTVKRYLDEWIAGKVDLRPTTRRSYRQHIDEVWIPALGRMEITAVRRAHVEHALNELTCSPATKQRYRATLRSALQDAVREQLLTVNPAALARVESGERPKVRPLEPAELGQLLDHVTADDLGPLLETIAATGLRRGEALGLRWDDIDLQRGVLVVRQQVVQIAGVYPCTRCQGHKGLLFDKPKTSSGDARTVELDSGTVGVLLEWRLRQDMERAAWGDAYVDHGLAFAQPDGNPLRPDEVTKRFSEMCQAAGVRRVRLHDLRHGAASLRLASGTDIAVVSKLLGHSSIAITADTYSHLLEGVGREAAERAAALVPRSRAGSPDPAGLPPGSRSSQDGKGRSPQGENAQVREGLVGTPPETRTRNPRIKSRNQGVPDGDG